jgi:hypothetical protein
MIRLKRLGRATRENAIILVRPEIAPTLQAAILIPSMNIAWH